MLRSVGPWSIDGARAQHQGVTALPEQLPRTDPVRRVVVGVDGSPASLAALAWSTGAVGPAGDVLAVHAVADPTAADAAQLEQWVAAVPADGATITWRCAAGDPIAALLAAADEVDADLVAVGAHGRSKVSPPILGHVVSGLVHRCERPVAIVGEHLAPSSAAPTTVVAGVGRGVATRAALDWAARFADARGTSLTLIHAVMTSPVFRTGGLLDAIAYYVDPGVLRKWANDDLAELADQIHESTERGVPVSWAVPTGSVGARLVDASADASLLVVGRHHDQRPRRHGVPHALHHAIIHAPCPVVVVPVAGGPPAEGPQAR
jgi:nucleotide-binding universal stress UspA family protein